MTNGSNRRPTVLVVGGGYGGIRVAKALDDIAEVTLLDPKEAFVHNIAAWRALVEPDWLDRIFFPYQRLLDKGRFVRGSAASIEGRRVTLATGEILEADYLVLATGSSYPFPAKNEEPDIASARRRVEEAHEALLTAERVLIIGAGPSGLELAGEIKSFYPEKQVTIADIADDILTGPYDQALRDELRRQLAAMDVTLQLGQTLSGLPDAEPATLDTIRISTADGTELLADIWFRAFGVRPHSDFLDQGSLADARDERGYVHVDDHLRVFGGTNVFALGDLSDADRDMAGVATRQAAIVAANIRTLITDNGTLSSYEKIPTLIAIPLGPEGGAGSLGDGLAGAATISEMKGREMGVANLVELFSAIPAAA
jgi:NADH dehydrogenase FAD-containing subunit